LNAAEAVAAAPLIVETNTLTVSPSAFTSVIVQSKS